MFICVCVPPPVYSLVADLQFNGTEKSEAKSLLQVKVILNPGCTPLWAAVLHITAQPLPSQVRFRHMRI